MTALRTVFTGREVWRSLIEDDPGWRIATLDETTITIRSVDWPSSTGYGDFDENGWLRLDEPA